MRKRMSKMALILAAGGALLLPALASARDRDDWRHEEHERREAIEHQRHEMREHGYGYAPYGYYNGYYNNGYYAPNGYGYYGPGNGYYNAPSYGYYGPSYGYTAPPAYGYYNAYPRYRNYEHHDRGWHRGDHDRDDRR